MVSAARIENDGKLTALVDAPVKVDINGHYSLPVTLTAGATNQLLVTSKSTSGTTLGSVVVEGGFATMSTVKVTPIDVNSTAEANLVVNAKSSGQWGSDFTLGELRALVSDASAATMGNAQADLAARQTAAVEALSAITAWRTMLALQGFTAANHTAMIAQLSTAQATLDTQLDASTSVDQKKAAATAYFSAFIKANADAAVTPNQLAAAASATADVMTLYSTSMDAAGKANVMARAEVLRASQVSAAVSADLQLIGATQQAQSVVTTAGATLQTQLAAAAQLGAGAQAAVSAAWSLYGTTVKAQLLTSLTVDAAITTAVDTAMAADLVVFNTAKASLNASTAVSITASAESQALQQFMTSVQSHSALLTVAGVTDVRATGYLHAVLLIDAAGAI